ncbi:ABC transporter substrate-binding protein [Rhodopila sp.]|uniref:ABC transporter substrate-binding protein n=1 Tax=Rhodopila sp. TaxID=2480087 RepID=UPI003D0A28F0
MLDRRSFLAASAAATVGARDAAAAPAQVLRIAMTASDLPTVTGIPNNGGEGFRFLGYPVYDGVVNWDYSHPDKTADAIPGLFESWTIDPGNPNRWIFTLRQGVTFHDGSPLTMDDIVWNLRRVWDDKSPQYDAPAAPIVRATVTVLDRWEKIDDSKIAIYTAVPFSFFHYLLTVFLIASPRQWEKMGRSWTGFAKQPSGTGPFRITRVVLGQYAEMTRNETYWNKSRIPKLERMIVYPMPEPTTRLAALRSGQVDWIEVPPPDAIPSLRDAGFQISLWPYPHTYPYVLNCASGLVFSDVRVRQAINFAIDRDGLCSMLNGTARPAYGFYPPDNPLFGQPKLRYGYDPDRARDLLKQAGYGPNKHAHAKIMISTSGSGQMVPIPINEFLQQNFAAVGLDVDFDVVEWGTMLIARRSSPSPATSHGDDGINNSLGYTDPSTMYRLFATASFPPAGTNWGHFSSARFDDLATRAQNSFDRAEQTKLLAEAHAILVDDAAWLYICHDLNPRAMSKRVRDFRPAQSWSQDFTQITMA